MRNKLALSRITRPPHGQSLVEFALILPLLLLIAFFILDFGRAVYYFSVINNAAREGARYAVVIDVDDPSASHLAEITAAARRHLYGIPAGSVTVIASRDAASETIHVRVTYCFTPVTPFVIQLVGSCMTLRSESAMFQER